MIVTRAERNPKNRKDCLNHWGYKCRVCSFDFGQVFGGVANEYIHVHHHNPLAFSGEIVSDPVNDMSPLCPNCHAVAHLHVPPYSIEELIAFRFNAEHGNKRVEIISLNGEPFPMICVSFLCKTCINFIQKI